MREVGFTNFLANLMQNALQLMDVYIVPLLRELGYSSTSFLEESQFAGDAEVPYEPKKSRRSVVVDEEKIET